MQIANIRVVVLAALVVATTAGCNTVSPSDGPATSPAADLTNRTSITQYGITWTFGTGVPVGQFITGDYYVVGPVTITGISPAPEGGRNGSMLNPPITVSTGYDNRLRFHKEELLAAPPIKMTAGDSLVSTISHDKRGYKHVYPQREPSASVLKTAAVLTCLAEPVAADTFRPSYCGPKDTFYRYSDLDLTLLPSVARVQDTPDLALYARIFQRPWIDHTFTWIGRAVHPTDNMPDYGREISRAVSEASLLLMCDFTPAEKKPIVVGLVQYGIDLYGCVRAGIPGWRANGGHASGRKWPILLAGILLDDEAMQHPTAMFGEDQQTYYGDGYYGATALWRIIRRTGMRGEHEHLPPSEYPDRMMAEGYRRQCTVVSWVGTALAARMMGAETIWNHPAYFDYVDRWMTEDDTQQMADLKAHFGRVPRERQGATWSTFVTQMWDTYRGDISPLRK